MKKWNPPARVRLNHMHQFFQISIAWNISFLEINLGILFVEYCIFTLHALFYYFYILYFTLFSVFYTLFLLYCGIRKQKFSSQFTDEKETPVLLLVGFSFRALPYFSPSEKTKKLGLEKGCNERRKSAVQKEMFH